MLIDPKARAFIEANIEYYREVTLAVKTFEAEAEAALRSLWREFKPQLAAVGIAEDDASFKVVTGEDASEMYLKTGWSTGIQIGITFQCRDDDDESGRFAVYSWVWVKDTELRRSLHSHIAVHLPAPFKSEFESGTTHVTAYLDLGQQLQAIDLLRDSFRILFECLFGSAEFCRSYNISGPLRTDGTTASHETAFGDAPATGE